LFRVFELFASRWAGDPESIALSQPEGAVSRLGVPPQFPQRPFKNPSITPPLRGSRRDKGAARSRSGGGQTRRRESEIQQWVGGAGQVPPTASAFAIRLGFCDSPSRGE